MSVRHNYTVPDYYPDFHCKAGACRHPCCVGWDIDISMKEYFHLLGMDCSPELRRKLDTAFRFPESPSEGSYAKISPRWNGDCPLRRENGYCALQCECGERALPAVCRYYPRTPASEYMYHCVCANSCEAVLELLMEKQAPLTFIKQNMTFQIEDEVAHHTDAMAKVFPAVGRACVRILQDRTRPLSRRLQLLGDLTRVMDVPYGQNNASGLRAVLPFASVAGNAEQSAPKEVSTDIELTEALKIIRDHLCELERDIPQLREDAKTTRALLMITPEGEISKDSVRIWRTLTARMDRLFPEREHFLENVLINHICHDDYPFTTGVRTMWECHVALCMLYALLQVTTVCSVAGRTDTADDAPASEQDRIRYIDTAAQLFRLAEHTSFAHNTAILARRWNITEPKKVYSLCKL